MDKIARDFWIYHATHPEVYVLFNKFALEMMTRGYPVGSAKLIIERIRWETMMNPTMINDDGLPLKLTNNFTCMYARLWEQAHGFEYFRKRVRKANTANSTSFDATEGRL